MDDAHPRIHLVLWQKGLVEREINELLRGLARDDANERNKSNHRRKAKVKILFHSYPYGSRQNFVLR